MAHSGWRALSFCALLLMIAGPTQAQITTYYLHRETQPSSVRTCSPRLPVLTRLH